ncbi:MAG: ComEC/Rec2 family competence protein [Bacteroidetes bacterium]|nr:ComEC/Rec2 family competence protein [Bacteroidota bacterium]
MSFLKTAPFFRILIPFLSGVIIVVCFKLNTQLNPTVLLVGLTGFIFCCLNRSIARSYRFRLVLGISINFLLFGFGYHFGCAVLLKDKAHSVQVGASHPDKEVIALRLITPPASTSKTYKFIAEMYATEGEQARQKIMIYILKNGSSALLGYGDVIVARLRPEFIAPPMNPHEFNYKQYLANRGILFSSFIDSSDWISAKISRVNPIRQKGYQLRANLIDVLNERLHNTESVSIASAIILGYKNELGHELKQAYAASGAMHILAVSGLHVGLIYVIFSHILSFLHKIRYGKFIKALLMLFVVWSFAVITGLSPSVERASIMLSFIIAGQAFYKNISIYNSLAASAFFLILTNPLIITYVGFQLSYLAVFGIILLQPKINSLFYFKNRLLTSIWALCSVSIAAQLATAPLGLFYFHQFPVYFLLTNLFAIPAATIILYLGILLFSINTVEWLANICGLVLNKVILVLNGLIYHLNSLPFAVVNEIHISTLQMMLVYMILFLFFSFFMLRHVSYLYTGLIALIALLLLQIIETVGMFERKQMIIYSIVNKGAVEFVNGSHSTLLFDTGLLKDERKMAYHIYPNWWANNMHTHLLMNYNKNNMTSRLRFLNLNTRTILIVDGSFEQIKNSGRFHLDYLILTGNPKVSLETILIVFTPKLVIFDSSNSIKRIKQWKEACLESGINYHDTRIQGAIIVDLNH